MSVETRVGPAKRRGTSVVLALSNPWVWRMAWRDSRTSRRRLLLFSSTITLGIAALVAIESFGTNLRENVDRQTKALLGADLEISSRLPFTPSQEELFHSIGGRQARGATFSSMLFIPASEQSRLIQAIAVDVEFPFYGQIDTEPPSASEAFREGRGVLLEPSLMNQFDVAPGDEVRLGEWSATVLGGLTKTPGVAEGFANIAPRVYLPYDKLEETRLLQARSLVWHERFFAFDAGVDPEVLVGDIRMQLRDERLEFDTVERRKRRLGRAMTNLYHFLNLAGFIALLLGSVGIASAIHVHVKQKLRTVAILRCLGCTSAQMFPVYLIQAIALGLIGTALGALFGLVFQQVLPIVVADFVPFDIEVSISWLALLQAVGVGFAISLLFALMPLLTVRRVSPLAAIRSDYEVSRKRDPFLWLVYGAIAAAVTAFSISQTQEWEVGAGFAAALGLALLLLAGVAKLITFLARRCVPSGLPYVWRQGLANLYRPNNRTLLLMLSLGLGTFLVLSLYLTHHLLITQLFPVAKENRPNTILFEIYQDQRDAVVELVQAQGLPVLQDVPIVSMRLSAVKGVTVPELLDRRDIPRWALRREYRSTYRDQLVESEQLLAGRWIDRFDGESGSVVPVSMERGIAEDLKVGVGDQVTFDVQGLQVITEVANIREVDWRRIQPNFFVVFPPGALEEAPSFHILATHVPTPEKSAQLQRAVVRQFPNVSAIDLTLVLETMDNILDRVMFVVRFMALLTVATGLLVLAGAVLTGKYQRVQESVLLRTLGASRAQVQQILLAEYLFLGLFAGLTGAVLSIGGSWGLARFVFKIDYSLAVSPLLITLGIVSGLVVLTGLLANRGVVRQPPLQVLRAETS